MQARELLNFKMRWGRPYVLLCDAWGDKWEPLDNLTDCEEAIAAFEQITGSSPPRPAPPPPATASSRRRFCRQVSVDLVPPGDLRAAFVGTILYCWPEDGWQRCTVARLCLRGAFSHVVAYVAVRPANVGAVRHGGHAARCSLLRRPLGAALPGPWCQDRPTHRLGGSCPPIWPGPPTLTFSLVGGSSHPRPQATPGSEAAEIVMSQNVL